jgi:hypothetical protein
MVEKEEINIAIGIAKEQEIGYLLVDSPIRISGRMFFATPKF